MLQFRVLTCHYLLLLSRKPYLSAVAVLERRRKSLRIRTYKPSLPQPLCHQHLQVLHTSVHSKEPTSRAESTLTQSSATNPFILRTYKKPGEGSHPTSATLHAQIVLSLVRPLTTRHFLLVTE